MRHRTRRTPRHAGFTLIELVVVMTIIAILAGAIGLKVYTNVKLAKRSRALADIKTLELALGTYQIHNGTAPSQQQGLQALVNKPSGTPEPQNWQGPYLRGKSVPKDPWGHEYVYQESQDDYTVLSYGKDGQPGGTDENADVTSEEAK